jgi:hypothetical protein
MGDVYPVTQNTALCMKTPNARSMGREHIQLSKFSNIWKELVKWLSL